MNDIAQIEAQNAAAIERAIPRHLQRGEWVVSEYAGLAFVGAEFFSGEGGEARARAKLAELNASGNSTHGKLHAPANSSGDGIAETCHSINSLRTTARSDRGVYWPNNYAAGAPERRS